MNILTILATMRFHVQNFVDICFHQRIFRSRQKRIPLRPNYPPNLLNAIVHASCSVFLSTLYNHFNRQTRHSFRKEGKPKDMHISFVTRCMVYAPSLCMHSKIANFYDKFSKLI